MTQTFIRFKFLKTIMLLGAMIVLIFAACSKSDTPAPPPPAPDKTTLQKALDSASYYSTHTVEGTKPGQYTAGSKAALNTAIASATTILNDPTSTQATLTNAAANLAGAIVSYKGTYIGEIAAVNLIAYWKMNGNANDSSGNGHNGTITVGHAFFGAGVLATTKDRFNQAGMAYHFDHGANIEVPYTPSLNPTQMSISAWVRQDTAGRTVNPANCYIVAMNRWNGFKFQTQPFLPFFTVKVFEPTPAPGDTTIYDRDDAGTAIVPGTAWYHLVATYKAGVEDFYINGTLVKEWTNTPGTPIALTSPVNLVIGADLPLTKYLTVDASGNFLVDYGGFWTGDMDDIMFYNVALTGPQVQSIYTNQSTL